MPFQSKKQRRWMHANKPEMADQWEREEKVKKKKAYSDIDLKENIEDGSDEVDKFVRGSVLEDLIREMSDGEMGPMMIKISTTKTGHMTEEDEDEDDEFEKLVRSKMS
jgi:hypothetical protein